MLNEPNIAKIRESVLFLLNSAAGDLDQYKIAKAIFLADISHLNRFGRPVTYDNYVAMKFGPIPSKTYELLKDKPERLEIAIKESCGNVKIYAPLRPHDELELSESDELELHTALKTVEPLSFRQLMELTHNHVAWKAAWGNRKNKAPKMEYALLFQDRDPDQADFIARFSRQIGCTI